MGKWCGWLCTGVGGTVQVVHGIVQVYQVCHILQSDNYLYFILYDRIIRQNLLKIFSITIILF
jgi:hypothetical protein